MNSYSVISVSSPRSKPEEHGVCQLPQAPGIPPVNCIPELRLHIRLTVRRIADHHATGFLKAVGQDPTLAAVKLIAEPWDCGPGGYQVGGFPPGWAEWNDKFRDTVRDFWRGEAPAIGQRGPLLRPCMVWEIPHDRRRGASHHLPAKGVESEGLITVRGTKAGRHEIAEGLLHWSLSKTQSCFGLRTRWERRVKTLRCCC